jgi:serine acetyltransferase
MIGADRKFNNIKWMGFVKAWIVPDSFNAVIWVRIYQWLERMHLPTFIAYRYLYHVHGLEMAKRVKIGEGLRLPHPRGVLFTKGMEIGNSVSIYGNVRFTRSWEHVPKLGNDVLVGDSVVFTGKGEVGNHVVIGAGSVVTAAFSDNVVIAGNPAMIIREKADSRDSPPVRGSR